MNDQEILEQNEKTIEKIKAIIEKIRPFILQDGGDLEYVGFREGVVYVRLHGACVGCSSIDVTLKDGIETILVDEVYEVNSVQLVS